jgi:transposase InsO family protein
VAAFIYVRTWFGFCYVAFIVDAFAHKIVAWHVATANAVDQFSVHLACECSDV